METETFVLSILVGIALGCGIYSVVWILLHDNSHDAGQVNKPLAQTYLDDFLSKFPDATLDEDGLPFDICIEQLYHMESHMESEGCPNNCKLCWRSKMPVNKERK